MGINFQGKFGSVEWMDGNGFPSPVLFRSVPESFYILLQCWKEDKDGEFSVQISPLSFLNENLPTFLNDNKRFFKKNLD